MSHGGEGGEGVNILGNHSTAEPYQTSLISWIVLPAMFSASAHTAESGMFKKTGWQGGDVSG